MGQLRKPIVFASTFDGDSETSSKFSSFPINRIAEGSERAVRVAHALWCFLFHRRHHHAHIVGLFDCECQCEKCGRLWQVN
jgi:hypothetical protein